MTVFQIVNPVLTGTLGRGTTQTGLTNAGNLISGLISLFLVIGTVAALLYMILGGVAWIVSDGDKGKLEQARNRILQAIVGLIIVAAAWAVWLLLGRFLGINFESIPFPSITGR